MTRPLLWLTRIFVAVGGVLLFLYLTILFIPPSEYLRLANKVLTPHGLSLSASSLGRAFPVGITGKGVNLSSAKGTLLSCDTVSVKVSILPLFIGRVIVSCSARTGRGTVDSAIEITRKGKLELSCRKVRLEDVPFFPTVTGARAKGELMLESHIQGSYSATPTGTIKLEAQGLELSGISISGTPLPDARYRKMQGMLRVEGGKVTLESVTLEGEEIYARLRGDLTAAKTPATSPLNLVLELMPKPDFLERQKMVFLLLAKYLDSPGSYQVPIRGTLASPSLQ